MIGQPLKLGTHHTDQLGPLRDGRARKGFDRLSESKSVMHRTVTGNMLSQRQCLLKWHGLKKFFRSLVDIAEFRLEFDDFLSQSAETEMSRLDDTGMYRSDRNLINPFPFDSLHLGNRVFGLEWKRGIPSEVLPKRIHILRIMAVQDDT